MTFVTGVQCQIRKDVGDAAAGLEGHVEVELSAHLSSLTMMS